MDSKSERGRNKGTIREAGEDCSWRKREGELGWRKE